jgi:hypothetical protein
MANERLSNLGYLMVGKEPTKGTPVIPSIAVPIYKETFETKLNHDEDNPIVGLRVMPFAMYMGLRDHEWSFTALGEPNTAQDIFDMTLTQGSVTGSNPYTHPYTVGDAKSYTIDILKGQVVHRYWGCEAEELEVGFNNNKMELSPKGSALGSFIVREIASVSTTTITLKTDYDATPNKGLVATDLVRVMKSDGSASLDTTVSSVNADGITVVLGASAASFAAGDYIFLRAQTATYNLLSPFLWAKTQYRFGTNAAAALTATHTPIEEGSGKWKVMHPFEDKGGSSRSGAFDPSALLRLQANAEVDVKTFFDMPDSVNEFLGVRGKALVVRHFTGSTNQYELRLTFNSCVIKDSKRELDSGKIIYHDINYRPVYSSGDGQLLDVKVINNRSSA